MKIFKFSLPYLLLLLIVGCFHKATPVSDDACGKNIVLLRDGYTTKIEVLREFGSPSLYFTYKNGRIIIYEIKKEGTIY